MTLRGIFSYQNLDSTSDLNSLNERIIDRGIFENGLLVPSATSLEISITPFKAVSYDGMVVVSDATETVSVTADAVTYLICFAKYLDNGPPQLEIKTVTESEWTSSVNRNYFITFAKLTVPSGATAVLDSYIDYTNADYADVLGKNTWRPRVSSYALLPTTKNRHGDIRAAGDRIYYWDSTGTLWSPIISAEITNLMLANWTTRPIGFTSGSSSLKGVTKGDAGIIFAVRPAGSDYPIYLSEDGGVTFDGKSVTGAEGFSSVTTATISGSEVYIAGGYNSGGDGIIATSSDGKTWSVVKTITSNEVRKVRVFDDNKIVAVGDNGVLYYSTDAVTFTDYTDTYGSDIRDISYDGTNWVTVSMVGLVGKLRQNTDITNPAGWVERLSIYGTMQSITYGNGRFVMTLDEKVYTSTDAITWVDYIVLPSFYVGASVIYVADYAKFLLFGYKVGDGCGYYSSTNGLVWENLTGSLNTIYRITDIVVTDRGASIVTENEGNVFFSLFI